MLPHLLLGAPHGNVKAAAENGAVAVIPVT
jgi:hypothetical protein